MLKGCSKAQLTSLHVYVFLVVKSSILFSPVGIEPLIDTSVHSASRGLVYDIVIKIRK